MYKLKAIALFLIWVGFTGILWDYTKEFERIPSEGVVVEKYITSSRSGNPIVTIVMQCGDKLIAQ